MNGTDLREVERATGENPTSGSIEPASSSLPVSVEAAADPTVATPLPSAISAGTPLRKPLRSRVDPERERLVLELLRSGRRDAALLLLLETYGGRVSSFIARFERDRERIKDIHQDVFLQAFRGLEQFRGSNNSSLWTWLCSITVNRCRDLYRKKSHLETAVSLDAPGVWDLLEASSNSSADINRVVMQRHLMECLDALPAPMQERILMHYVWGLSYSEIAEKVSANTGTVQVSIWRMLRQLKNCMGGKGGEDGRK